MNFNDLYKTIRAIDENAQPVAPVHTDGPAKEEGIEIIGGPMGMPSIMGHQEPPKQQDNVTMNVSLNGSGAGGVRSLMNILKDIEDGKDGHDHDALFGEPSDGAEEPIMGDMIAHMANEEGMDETFDDDKEVWGNSAHGSSGHHTHGVDAVTFSGDDMNSKGKVSPLARAPGTNALQHPMHESLVDKLTAMYETIKEERTEEKDEKGNVIRWQEEGEWKKSEKKDGRGKVTNMSDKARRETEKMAKKDVKENAHHEDDEERKIRHLMRKYGWSRQEALEYYHYEEHDPTDYEDMEESQLYENDLEKALDSTAGGFTGWNHMQGKSYENYGPYKHHVRTAVKNGADVYHYDDGEGGYDATGEVVYDKNNGIYYAVINKEPSTHKSLGSLMNLIRNEIGENGRRHDANNQHRSDSLDREPFDPEQHLYKTDRAGKKGMLNKGRINDLTSPYRRKITGPQSVLPEQMNESKELNDIIALTKYLKG
jgi:hypothetical protein